MQTSRGATQSKGRGRRMLANVESVLRDLGAPGVEAPLRYVLTGESGSGKSIWCTKLAEAARTAGLVIGGVISPGVYRAGRRVAIELQDVGTGERRTLARLRRQPDPTATTMKWKMAPEVVEWGNAILARAVNLDLLIIDEIGPLELLHAGGILASMQAVDREGYRAAVIVIRPSLLEQAMQRWPDSRMLSLPLPR